MQASDIKLVKEGTFPAIYQCINGVVVLFTSVDTGTVLKTIPGFDDVGTHSEMWSLGESPHEWTRVKSITLTDD